jgi:hypothetical protein
MTTTDCQHDEQARAWDAVAELGWIRREALALSRLPVPAEDSLDERAAWQERWDAFTSRKAVLVAQVGGL